MRKENRKMGRESEWGSGESREGFGNRGGRGGGGEETSRWLCTSISKGNPSVQQFTEKL